MGGVFFILSGWRVHCFIEDAGGPRTRHGKDRVGLLECCTSIRTERWTYAPC